MMHILSKQSYSENKFEIYFWHSDNHDQTLCLNLAYGAYP